MIPAEQVRRILASAPGAICFAQALAAPSEIVVDPTSAAGERVAAELDGLGMTEVAGTWAGWKDGRTVAVRINAHRHFGEIAAAATTEADGLTTPDAAHVVLLCAERLVADPAVETAVVAAMAQAALDQDPSAWPRALKRGLDWGLWRALSHLERALTGATVSTADRADGRQELERRSGAPLRRPLEGALVALSGVDGAGKSLQGRSLHAALSAAGVPAAVEWTRVATDRRLDALARPVARAAAAVRGLGRAHGATQPDAAAAGADAAGGAGDRLAARSLRERSRVVNFVWAYVVAALTVGAQRKSSRLHRSQGRVVIRDRYTVDAVVQLRDDYGVRCGALARSALRRLSPRPTVSFLLHVRPEVALARKHEQYDIDDLARLTCGYLRAADELHVTVVDGERAPDAISAEIFDAVWRALGQTQSASRSRRTG